MNSHPWISSVSELMRPQQSAAELGYRMPGEFEPIEAVWLVYPHNEETWPGTLEQARREYDYFVQQLQKYVRVELITPDSSLKSHDAWIRDYGPIFVKNHRNELACHDFQFTGWGGKYGDLYAEDDVIPQHIAKKLQIPIWIHDFVLEGGSIEVNGQGTLLTTEQCLLNPNRNPHFHRHDIERHLYQCFRATNIIWLAGGIRGDDTDGHIDDIARFINPTTIVAVRAKRNHPDYYQLEKNWSILQNAVDQDGQLFTCIALPAPEPLYFDLWQADKNTFERQPLPASYANFLIANNAVLVPTFAQASDEIAIRILAQALPHHDIISIPSNHLVMGLGALHCLSQQQPQANSSTLSAQIPNA